ncbi:uncharacterized protein PADG_12257 [Paracoccidioides brasiliensis Pb18]|uniref:Uncharacterized protein n=1 Tax=Paracoccidioides brasiliensis (strain Pb18) TaxID=502780 RepID=A0A0A0HWB0_PARBD|nr:uncharacterized protein PADG_12257 [Paracoccidioides brasiliensis Pb18]KGM91685.1 hypothetical protein PADG_12257 [Paracoccidioides brasiliensis Pb18]
MFDHTSTLVKTLIIFPSSMGRQDGSTPGTNFYASLQFGSRIPEKTTKLRLSSRLLEGYIKHELRFKDPLKYPSIWVDDDASGDFDLYEDRQTDKKTMRLPKRKPTEPPFATREYPTQKIKSSSNSNSIQSPDIKDPNIHIFEIQTGRFQISSGLLALNPAALVTQLQLLITQYFCPLPDDPDTYRCRACIEDNSSFDPIMAPQPRQQHYTGRKCNSILTLAAHVGQSGGEILTGNPLANLQKRSSPLHFNSFGDTIAEVNFCRRFHSERNRSSVQTGADSIIVDAKEPDISTVVTHTITFSHSPAPNGLPDRRGGKGYIYLGPGHFSSGSEPSRMCSKCALLKVTILECTSTPVTDTVVPIQGIDEKTFFDTAAAFEPLFSTDVNIWHRHQC